MSYNEKIAEGDKHADKIIKVLSAEVLIASTAPVVVSWAALVPSISAAIISIGQAYGVKWTRDEAWHFIRQCFLGGGFWCAAVLFGYKFCVALLQTTGIGYLAAYGLDASLNTAAAYAIGHSAKLYFREILLSHRRLTDEMIYRNFFTSLQEARKKRLSAGIDQSKRRFFSPKEKDTRLSAYLAEGVNLAKRRGGFRKRRRRKSLWSSLFH